MRWYNAHSSYEGGGSDGSGSDGCCGGRTPWTGRFGLPDALDAEACGDALDATTAGA